MGQNGRVDVNKNSYSYEQRNFAESSGDRLHSDVSTYSFTHYLLVLLNVLLSASMKVYDVDFRLQTVWEP